MKHIVRKAFFSYEKEEKYLNEMAAKGLAFTNYTFCRYVFEDAPKGEYIYRLELLEKPVNHPETRDYIKFMEESGVEFVTSYGRWAYFRRKASDGEFCIYSDNDSKLKHYKRIRMSVLAVVAINLLIGLMNCYYADTQAAVGMPPVNAYISIFSFAAAALLFIFLIVPLSKKIIFLKREKDICE